MQSSCVLYYKYSGTSLMRSPVGPKKIFRIKGARQYYWERVKYHDLRAVIANTPYIASTLLEQLFSLINNQNVDIAHSNCKSSTSNIPYVYKTLLKIG